MSFALLMLTHASSSVFSLLEYGLTPSSYTSFQTGLMIASDINNASDVMTWVEGSVCNPKAARSRPRTTTIRTKQVVIKTIAGARLTAPNNNTVCNVLSNCSGVIQADNVLAIQQKKLTEKIENKFEDLAEKFHGEVWQQICTRNSIAIFIQIAEIGNIF